MHETQRPSEKSKKEFTRKILVFYILGAYLILTFCLIYFISSDVLSKNPELQKAVREIAQYLPGVRRFGLWSTFPEPSQLVYALQILGFVPMLLIVFIV